MLSRAIVKFKLPFNQELVDTVIVYRKALQYCIDTAWGYRIKNAYELQTVTYKHLRSLGLHSQLSVACIKQASGMVKKAKTKPIISKDFISYNPPRSFSYKHEILSIATLYGRRKFSVKIPQYAVKYINWKVSESILIIDKTNRIFFCMCFSKDIDVPIRSTQHRRVLGIDVGIKHLATTSDEKFFGSVTPKMKRHQRIVSQLQRKGTKSAKRHLKRLSGRWTRFMRDTNHQISKEIVESMQYGDIIAMENIKHIRGNKGRRFNRQLHSWAFAQLQSFIEYKAVQRGVVFVKIDPKHTSKACSRCGAFGIRNKNFFKCECGYSCNADLNAAFNIRNRTKPLAMVFGHSVNMPIVSQDDGDCFVFHNNSSIGVTSPRALAVGY